MKQSPNDQTTRSGGTPFTLLFLPFCEFCTSEVLTIVEGRQKPHGLIHAASDWV
jgi:hypothetical protein